MSDAWFKPKTHGYGASPVNWKGWAATLCYAVVTFAVTWGLVVWPASARIGPQAWHLVLWLVLTGLLTVGFIRLCKAKTDGEWRWRWGKES